MEENVKIYEAKSWFSKLIAKIVPFWKATESREPGSAIGKLKIKDDFTAPLPKDIENKFYS